MPATVDCDRSHEVVKVCQKLHQQGFLAAADGNISYRDDNHIAITPSGVAKSEIDAGDLALIAPDGTILRGTPSSETPMHTTIYRHCPKARAVVHAHPPHAIAWSVAKPELSWLPAGALSELILAVGAVPIVPYARPSSAQLAENLVPFLPQHRAMILSRHGVICWGESLDEAYHGVERIEHAAKVLCLALQMGGITELPGEEVDSLKAMRAKLGDRIL